MPLHIRPNRLIRENSPYLLRHARNPVDWYPWGDEAFATARRENRIIFLSIGYATCHWCHVMERESFENPEVAAVLNTLTVPVKVDREERPDVDRVYMAVCQALNGTAGWPLTVLLTPDRRPFFAATYLPKRTRAGRIGVIELVRQAAALWRSHPDRVLRSAREIAEHFARAARPPAPAEPSAGLFQAAEAALRDRFDPVHAGFSPPPKFPTPHNLVFLLRRHRRTGPADLRDMAVRTLAAMRNGGLYDHLGYGFHRYSTDARWLVPHFEKMLYDQAGLLAAYAEGWQAVRHPLFERTAREVATYVMRDLAAPGGGFCSAEDADSEGEEGRFYLWTQDEIVNALGPGPGERFCAVYGATPEGNHRDEATGRPTGRNVLHLTRPLEDWAGAFGMNLPELERELEYSRAVLLRHRSRRERPERDDKILAGWNGLMASALARAGWIFDAADLVRASERAVRFVLGSLFRNGRLFRSHRNGRTSVPAVAEDYAFLARACLDLYAAAFEPAWLAEAARIARELVNRFWDGAAGGLYDAEPGREDLPWPSKEVYDGAVPSANSTALEVFARLGLLTGDPWWTDRAWELARAFAGEVSRYPAAFTAYLSGLAYLLEPTRVVVIAGPPGRPDTQALLEAVRGVYAPETLLLLAPPGKDTGSIPALPPYVSSMGPWKGRAAAYVCQDYACRDPVTAPDELAALLKAPP